MEEIVQSLNDMSFETFEDLYERRKEIREKFKKKDENVKKLYKWYFFYQLCILDYKLKSLMWDYIYGIEDCELPLGLAYSDWKRKKEEYHLKYLLEEQKKKEF